MQPLLCFTNNNSTMEAGTKQMFNSSSFFHKGSKGALSVRHTQNLVYKERMQIKCMSVVPFYLIYNKMLFIQPETYPPGVSRIRGILSSRGSLTISRKAVMPIWPHPMSSWRSRWQPNFPF